MEERRALSIKPSGVIKLPHLFLYYRKTARRRPGGHTDKSPEEVLPPLDSDMFVLNALKEILEPFVEVSSFIEHPPHTRSGDLHPPGPLTQAT